MLEVSLQRFAIVLAVVGGAMFIRGGANYNPGTWLMFLALGIGLLGVVLDWRRRDTPVRSGE